MGSALRTVALFVGLLALAPGARASELLQWDQAKVIEFAKQLEKATAALSDAFRRQPPPTLGSSQRQPFFRLQQEVRNLRRDSRSLSRALQRGADRDETLPSYESLMQTVRSATDIARRVFTSTEIQTRADAARDVLNQLAPYFDAGFTPLEPPARR